MAKQGAEKLASLARLTDMVADANLAKLKAARAETAQIRARIADLDDATQASTQAMTEDFRRFNGAELRWRKWQEAQRAMLLQNLARALAKEAEQRQSTSRAVGRNQVIETLSGKFRR